MLNVNQLSSQFGKIFANIVREMIRCDGIISRDSHLTASYLKSCANDNCSDQTSFEAPARANNAILANKQKRDQSGESDSIVLTAQPSSSLRFAKTWTPNIPEILHRQFEPERTLNDAVVVRAKKHLLKSTAGVHSENNVNVALFTKSFIRKMSMLARPPKPLAIVACAENEAISATGAKRWLHPKINNRDNCAEWCGEDPCNLNRKETKLRKSMWLAPDCHDRLKCPKPYRYDIVYMPGSNKATREYQQTWVECPPIRIVKKPVCCMEPKCLPPICRRPRKVRPPVPECKKDPCGKKEEPACKKVKPPCCFAKARDPPCCKIYPTPSCCQKRCTPYPSFSECCRPDSNRKRPVECLCLARPTMCEIWADWRKKYLAGGL